ncbi:hypothetical protein [Cupriavidus necator]|uniref:hypothetical protein n=1 Tax=Cupriavidus necator TaxID=106590 RepID=UPI0012FFCAB5|nr:hypothetical protein [Cupriavidus necator]QQB81269.1 hypothetical protein I6H87_33175 [Cupriavidus necator]
MAILRADFHGALPAGLATTRGAEKFVSRLQQGLDQMLGHMVGDGLRLGMRRHGHVWARSPASGIPA